MQTHSTISTHDNTLNNIRLCLFARAGGEEGEGVEGGAAQAVALAEGAVHVIREPEDLVQVAALFFVSCQRQAGGNLRPRASRCPCVRERVRA